MMWTTSGSPRVLCSLHQAAARLPPGRGRERNLRHQILNNQLCGTEYQQLFTLVSDYDSTEEEEDLLVNHHHLCHLCISTYLVDACLATFTNFTLTNILLFLCKFYCCLNTRNMKCTVMHYVMAPRLRICLPYFF